MRKDEGDGSGTVVIEMSDGDVPVGHRRPADELELQKNQRGATEHPSAAGRGGGSGSEHAASVGGKVQLGKADTVHFDPHEPVRDASAGASSAGDAQTLQRHQTAANFIAASYDKLVDYFWSERIRPAGRGQAWASSWKRIMQMLKLITLIRNHGRFSTLLDMYDDLDPDLVPPAKLEALRKADSKKSGTAKREKVQTDKANGGGDRTSRGGEVAARQTVTRKRASQATESSSSSSSSNTDGSSGSDSGSEPEEAQQQQRQRKEAGWHSDFQRNVDTLLRTSGFQPISKDDLRVANERKGKEGLDVSIPPHDEVQVHVYYRGRYTLEEMERNWKACGSEAPVLHTYFRETFFCFSYSVQEDNSPPGLLDKLKWKCLNIGKRRAVGPPGSEGKLFLRQYKDVPLDDLDVLWPGASPNPKLLDALLVIVPFLVGLGTAIYKIYTLFHDDHDLTDWQNLLVILVAIVGPFVVSFKAFSKAKGKYYKYKQRQASMLAHHTLSTNRGTLRNLLTEAADQDNKEICIAYSTLALTAPKTLAKDDLRRECDEVANAVSEDKTALMDVKDIHFDIDGALWLLKVNELLRSDAGGYSAVPPEEGRKCVSLSRYEERDM